MDELGNYVYSKLLDSILTFLAGIVPALPWKQKEHKKQLTTAHLWNRILAWNLSGKK
jgi:hypothetical protein